MKKILLLLALTLSIFSCSSDDDATITPAPTNAELLVGTWKLKTQTENGVKQTLSACELQSTANFDGSKLIAKTYLVKSSSTGGSTCELKEINAPYTVDNETISLSVDKDIRKLEILAITSNYLEIKVVQPNSKALQNDVLIETYSK